MLPEQDTPSRPHASPPASLRGCGCFPGWPQKAGGMESPGQGSEPNQHTAPSSPDRSATSNTPCISGSVRRVAGGNASSNTPHAANHVQVVAAGSSVPHAAASAAAERPDMDGPEPPQRHPSEPDALSEPAGAGCFMCHSYGWR